VLYPKFLFDRACTPRLYRSVHKHRLRLASSNHPPIRMADSLQSRRDLLAWAIRATTFAGALPALALPAAAAESPARPTPLTQEFSLAGEWLFRLDSDGSGEAHKWQQSDFSAAGWAAVVVPHTWQVMPGTEEYRGVAWYRRYFIRPPFGSTANSPGVTRAKGTRHSTWTLLLCSCRAFKMSLS